MSRHGDANQRAAEQIAAAIGGGELLEGMLAVAYRRALDEGLLAPAGDLSRDYLPDCASRGQQHWWTTWRSNHANALREERFCFECGVMETQTIALSEERP